MPRDLHPLPRSQVLVNVASSVADLVLHRLDFRLEIERVLIGMAFQILQPALQLQDRLLKLERMNVHR